MREKSPLLMHSECVGNADQEGFGAMLLTVVSLYGRFYRQIQQQYGSFNKRFFTICNISMNDDDNDLRQIHEGRLLFETPMETAPFMVHAFSHTTDIDEEAREVGIDRHIIPQPNTPEEH